MDNSYHSSHFNSNNNPFNLNHDPDTYQRTNQSNYAVTACSTARRTLLLYKIHYVDTNVDDFNYSPADVGVGATNGVSVTRPDGAIWGYYFTSGVAIVTGKIKAFKFNGWYSYLQIGRAHV